jgi:transmembrane sensor
MNLAPVTQDVAAQAASWYARLHADDAAPAERMAFDRWLAADDAHRAAWEAQMHIVQTLDAGRDDTALLAMIAAARGTPSAKPKRWWPMAAAAAVLIALGGTTAMILDDRGNSPPTEIADIRYATPIGGLRTITLTDGTVMTLDAASAVRVSAPSAIRRVAIEHGQAFFKVAHDPAHPFVVSVGGNSVTALGTQFAVRSAPGRFVVSLIEGSVRVDTPAIHRTTTLVPGDALTIDRDGLQLTAAGADVAAGWRNGELTFDSVPLREVVADLNRYSSQRIELADARLAKRVFSGVLKTDQGGSALVDALSAYGIAHVRAESKARLVLASN